MGPVIKDFFTTDSNDKETITMPKPAKQQSNADLMREWRKVNNYSRDDAGEVLGLSGRTIEGIEQGRFRSNDKLSRLGIISLLTATSNHVNITRQK